jgi:hypothetical protein
LPAFVERCRTCSHGPNCEYHTARNTIPLTTGLDDFDLDFMQSPICACGRGQNLPESIPGVPAQAWKHMRPFATRAAISPLFAVSYVSRVAGQWGKLIQDTLKSKETETKSTLASSERCLVCGGPGKPKLMLCSVCKSVKYCSRACSKAHWKSHKRTCRSL